MIFSVLSFNAIRDCLYLSNSSGLIYMMCDPHPYYCSEDVYKTYGICYKLDLRPQTTNMWNGNIIRTGRHMMIYVTLDFNKAVIKC